MIIANMGFTKRVISVKPKQSCSRTNKNSPDNLTRASNLKITASQPQKFPPKSATELQTSLKSSQTLIEKSNLPLQSSFTKAKKKTSFPQTITHPLTHYVTSSPSSSKIDSQPKNL